MSYSKTTLFGRLGGDPELRYLPDGTAVTNISLATDKPVKEANGSWGKKTVWWKISFFGRKAEVINEYLHKGSQVLIEAKNAEVRVYDKNEGGQGFSLEAQGVEVVFGESKDQRSEAGVSEFNQTVDEGDVPF